MEQEEIIMKNRKKAGVLLTLLLALGLAGCGTEQAASTPSAAPSAAQPVGQQGALRVLQEWDEQGYYEISYNFSRMNPQLAYLDYASTSEMVLCAAPNCTHSDDSCTAWAEGGDRVQILDEGHILIFGGIKDQAFLEMAHRDGSSRRVLLEDPSSWESIQPVGEAGFLADDAFVYYLRPDWEKDGELFLCRVPIAGGEPEVLAPWGNTIGMEPLMHHFELLGVQGRQLILQDICWTQEEVEAPPLPEGVSEEEYKLLLEQNHREQQQTNQARQRTIARNVDTGEEITLLDRAEGEKTTTQLWSGGRLYWMERDAPEQLHWVTLEGQTGQQAVQWPQSIGEKQDVDLMLEKALGGKLLVRARSLDFQWDEERLALDLEDGSTTLINLKCMSNGNLIPMPIKAIGEKEVLVEMDVDGTKVEVVVPGPDGVPSTQDAYMERLGLISQEDYLAGRPNFREITRLSSV